MRIGEILLEHGWVDRASLERALAEQPRTGLRLCSLLIARGLLDADLAARALGQQHGVAAALQRHLDHRERALANLLSHAIARAAHALPIGRMRDGQVIVCMRDPRLDLRGVIAGAIAGPVVIAVAPAGQLEPLIAEAYPEDDPDAIEVDLSTQPIAIVSDLGRLRLVDLDDSRVARDPTQTGTFVHAPGLSVTKPPPIRSAASPNRSSTPLSIPVIAGPISLAEAVDAIDAATSIADATGAAMRFAVGRWLASLLLAVRDGSAVGERGHGAQLTGDAVRAIALPLDQPSLVSIAVANAALTTAAPRSRVQERLIHALGAPRIPAAAPVRVGLDVAYVLAVGDPVASDAAHAFDAERVAAALGDAFTRLA